MCGLMHQVGKPVLLSTLVELRKHTRHPLTEQSIASILEHYHCLVGYWLAEAWKLPDSIRTACLYYKEEDDRVDKEKEVLVTHLASRLAALTVQPDEQIARLLRQSPAFERLGLDAAILDQWVQRADAIMEEVRALVF
jgi:HD-like signal output (HDOD) protein